MTIKFLPQCGKTDGIIFESPSEGWGALRGALRHILAKPGELNSTEASADAVLAKVLLRMTRADREVNLTPYHTAQRLGLDMTSAKGGGTWVVLGLAANSDSAFAYVDTSHWAEGGGFAAQLGDTWAVADMGNRAKMAEVFTEQIRKAQFAAVADGSYLRWLESLR